MAGHFPAFAAAALLLGAAPKPAQVAEGKRLLAQAIEAAGGTKALDALQDITLTGTLRATMGEDDIDGAVTMRESRDGSTRDELTFGGFEMIASAGPSGAWTSQAGISTTLAGADLANAQAQSRFTPLGLLLHGGEPGATLFALPSEPDFDVLEVDPAGADPIVFYLDSKTHLVTRVKLVASKDGTTVVSRYGLYRPEDGVKIAHQLALTQAGFTMILSFTGVRINAGAGAAKEPALAKETPREIAAKEPAPAADPKSDVKSDAKIDAPAELTIRNRTGKTLNNLHLSPHDKKEWGASLLPVDKFHDGDTATVRYRAKGECVFDLMITDVDGHYWVVPGADLCVQHALTLRSKKSAIVFDAK